MAAGFNDLSTMKTERPIVLALRHVHFEDLGTLEPLLRGRGYEVRYVDPALDDLEAIDATAPALVVALGGPVSAVDENSFPFLASELRLLKRRLASGKPLLGICLGAQLIARLAGARVQPMGHHEIGFSPLVLASQGAPEPSVLAPLAGVPVLHWHGDHFELPRHAQLLASTDLCTEQAFILGTAVLGLQFHLEADPRCIEQWLVGHSCELRQAGVAPHSIRADAQKFGGALEQAAQQVFTRWLESWES